MLKYNNMLKKLYQTNGRSYTNLTIIHLSLYAIKILTRLNLSLLPWLGGTSFKFWSLLYTTPAWNTTTSQRGCSIRWVIYVVFHSKTYFCRIKNYSKFVWFIYVCWSFMGNAIFKCAWYFLHVFIWQFNVMTTFAILIYYFGVFGFHFRDGHVSIVG